MPSKVQGRVTKQIVGMNGYDDPTGLPEGVVKYIQNMLPMKGAMETRKGWTAYNDTALPNSSGIFGLAPYRPAQGQFRILAVSDGKLYSGDDGTFTQIYSGLSSNTQCRITQFQDVALIVDQVNKMLVYRAGETPFEAGIASPKIYKLIEDFESAAQWTVTNGTATNNKVNHTFGTQCITFLTNVGATMTAVRTFSSLNLTVHTDGSTSGTNDYISFFLIRGTMASFSSLTLEIGDGGSTNCYRVVVSSQALWTGNSAPNVALNFKIRKSAFTTVGSPNWNNITGIKWTAVAAGGQQAQFICDFMRLEKAGPSAADGGSSGNLTGTYYYRVTYVTADGWESDPSLISDAVSVSARNVALTNIPATPSARVASKKIYRIGGSSAEWRLLTILHDRNATSYTDNIPDGQLGSLQEIVEGQPYIPKLVTVHDRHVVIADLKDFDGTNYPCGIMVSRENSFDIFDHDDFFEIEPTSGGSIKWIISAMDFIIVGKSDSIWKFDPLDLSIPPRNLSRNYSGVGPYAVTEGENEIFFLDGAKRIISFNGSHFQDIGKAGHGRPSSIQNFLDNIPDAYIHLSWMAYFDSFLFAGIPQGSSTVPNLILVYYVPAGIWTAISGWSARCAFSTLNNLYLGHASTGYVYDALTGDTDAGTDITSIIQTADSDFGQPEVRKDYAKAFLFGKKLTSTNVTLTVEPFIDLADSGHDLTVTVNSTTHNRFEIPIPQLGYAGTFLGLRITATKRWSLRLLSEVARMIGEPI